MIEEEKVRVPSKKKYTCKRNKGEHEYLEPVAFFKPLVRYIYKTNRGILDSGKLCPEHKYLKTEISVSFVALCKHCGHRATSFMIKDLK